MQDTVTTKEPLATSEKAAKRAREVEVTSWLANQIRNVSIAQPRTIVDKWVHNEYLYLAFKEAAYIITVMETTIGPFAWQERVAARALENGHVLTEFAYTTSKSIGNVAQCTGCGALVCVSDAESGHVPQGDAILNRTCPEADYEQGV